MGFRSAHKEDIGATTSELVYGKTIRLPGEFFNPTPMDASPKQFVEDLKSHFASVRPTTTSSQGQRTCFIHPRLHESTHVFVRHDGVRKPLQDPYDGPFKVLERRDKTFDVEIKGNKQTISIDRLKPAFVTMGSSQVASKSVKKPSDICITCSGRLIRPPHR
ncbi:hypothetical protein X975_11147, partial [Stegodyphus mimosarum]